MTDVQFHELIDMIRDLAFIAGVVAVFWFSFKD
jgi:hypothetical protein